MKSPKQVVADSLGESLKSSIMSEMMARIVREEVSKMVEDTTLVSLVAKCPKESKINAALGYLKKNGIEARSIEDAQFNPGSATEAPSWGIMVEPKDVKTAARILRPVAKGFTFDPYIQTG